MSVELTKSNALLQTVFGDFAHWASSFSIFLLKCIFKMFCLVSYLSQFNFT